MFQTIAIGDLPEVKSGRSVLAASGQCISYNPHPNKEWDDACMRFMELEQIDPACAGHRN